MIKKEEKPKVIAADVITSFALTFRGETLIVVDRKLPKAKQIGVVAELKSKSNPAHRN